MAKSNEDPTILMRRKALVYSPHLVNPNIERAKLVEFGGRFWFAEPKVSYSKYTTHAFEAAGFLQKRKCRPLTKR